MDVMGKMQVKSKGGAQYCATMLDDSSDFSLVATLESKADVPDFVKSGIQWFETQTGRKVKAVRTDRGGEYVNEALTDFYRSKGIDPQLTAPYSPQSNGKAERLNRTLMEKAKSMLFGAKQPPELWGEAIRAANYVRVRSPVAGKAKTPYELLLDKKPDVSHLRVWGSTAYPMIPKELRRKLDPVSEKGVLVGYESSSKAAYRVLLDSGELRIRRDVMFDELKQQLETPATEDMALELDLPRRVESDSHVPAPPLEAAVVEQDGPPAEPALEQEEHDFEDARSEGSEGMVHNPLVPEERVTAQELRRSTRDRRPPSTWWKAGKAEIKYTDLKAPPSLLDPQTYKEAMAGPDASKWKASMMDEIQSLLENETYTLEKVPPGVKPLQGKWVYTKKRDETGKVARYKSRWVVKGFLQREGIDYTEVYAPTSKMATLRYLLSEVVDRDMEMHQLDVKTAFLYGELEEDIWMQQPTGFEEGGPDVACHLKKALYGLKQAPRAWHAKLKKELEGAGFKASETDPALFIKNNKDHSVFILVWVDDMLIASESLAAVDETKTLLKKAFTITDIGEARFFLGMEVYRDRKAGELKLSQARMTKELVKKYMLEDAKPKATPLTAATKLSKEGKPLQEGRKYSELVGSLMYLSTCTRADISQAVGALARYMAAPMEEHWNAARGVIKYLAGTTDLGIKFKKDMPSNMIGYCDADYAGDLDTRRSTTGFVFVKNGGVVSWQSRLQQTVAVSTAEAEYMAAGSAVKEGLWLRKLIGDFGKEVRVLSILCDNQAAITLLKNPISSARSKHIDVIHHFARERVARGEIEISYVSTDKMVADCMTKAVPESKFLVCREGMGIE
jgi:hypothetical protein